MGAIVPQVITEDRAGGALVIDGGLRFDSSKSQYLTRTPGSAGNTLTWTFSCWLKRNSLSATHYIIRNSSVDEGFYFNSNSNSIDIYRYSGSFTYYATSPGVFRDISSWYHIVYVHDATQSTGSRLRLYVNGVLQNPLGNLTDLASNTGYSFNAASAHRLGEINGQMSNVYLIDGQALDPSYFGYTDPLTNTWRPKNFDVKKNTLNNGTVWSNTLTKSSEHASNTPVSLGFDGITGTGNNNFVLTGGGGTIEWTASSYSFPPNSTVEVWKSNTGGANYRYWNVDTGSGYGSNITEDGNSGWLSLGTLSNIQKIRCVGTNVDGYGAAWGAIRINGITLVDSNGFGANGFYLPLDGNTPIGQDRSGRGNDWTPVNFGGSNTIEKATGALPILNTDGGGKVARVGVRTDSNASSLVLALPLVGIKSDFSNAINSGTSNKAITVSGSAAGITTISNFYGGSFNFGTATASAVYPSATSSDFAFGTGDFTVEFWFYSTATSRKYLGDFRSNGAGGDSGSGGPFIIWADDGADNTGTRIRYANNAGTPNFDLLGGRGLPPINTWHHLAIVRRSNTVSGYLNGVLTNSTTDSTNYSTNTSFSFGNALSNSSNFSGYLQDLRIYKGLSKYTQNFIPASTDPDILPDTPSGVSYSSNVTAITDGAVAFDGSGDTLSIADSADFDVASGDFTLEGYIYPQKLSSYNIIFDDIDTNRSGIQLSINSSGNYQIEIGDGANNWIWQSTTIPVKGNNWSHIALTRSGSSFRFFVDGILQGSTTSSTALGNPKAVTIGGWSSGSDYYFQGFISNFHFVKGTALYTSNFTPPIAPITSVANTKLLCCQSNTSVNRVAISPAGFSNNGTIWSNSYTASNSFQSEAPKTNAFDGNISTRSACSTSGCTVTFTPASPITVSTSLRIYSGYGSASVNGGSAVDFTGVDRAWVNLNFTGTLTSLAVTGQSGFNAGEIYAIEVDGCVLIDNFSGKALAAAGNAAPTNFNPFTANINAVRGQESSYATLNPLVVPTGYTLSKNNLQWSKTTSGDTFITSNQYVSSGKYYAEGILSATESGSMGFCVVGSNMNLFGANNQTGFLMYFRNGQFYGNSGGVNVSGYATYDVGDVIGIAIDKDNQKVSFYKNNILINTFTVSSYLTTDIAFGFYSNEGTSRTSTGEFNFGQKPFKFPPPAGFQPLALANTPRPTIVRPDQYVGISTWTGTGATRDITVGWKPDFVWIKERGASGGPVLYDSVRGATKHLASHVANAEATDTDALTSFNSNGFSLGSGYTVVSVNGSTRTYVGWAWKAGGSGGGLSFWKDDVGYATASAAGLTAGTITPTGASINTKSGFSIIGYTANLAEGGATISHGLGRKPAFAIFKNRDSTLGVDEVDWGVYHQSLGATKKLELNQQLGAASFSGPFNNTEPTSSLFYFGGRSGGSIQGHSYLTNGPANDRFIAYIWAEIPGFSKFGTYSGVSSVDGPVVITGFRPKWVLIKRTDNDTENWQIRDATRNPFNPTNRNLTANLNNAEGASTDSDIYGTSIDILSNGFKLRGADGAVNTGGGTYIYAAFAETPSFNLYGGQANAR